MTYRVEFAPRAERQFRKLSPDVQRRLAPVIDGLSRNPVPRGVRKLSDEDNVYRIRSGDYRILYQIRDRELIVLVVGIGDRRDIYRNL